MRFHFVLTPGEGEGGITHDSEGVVALSAALFTTFLLLLARNEVHIQELGNVIVLLVPVLLMVV